MTGSKSTIDLNVFFFILPEIWYLKPKTKLNKCVFSFNKYWRFHFVLLERTDFKEYRFFHPYFHRKKHLKLKHHDANTFTFLLSYSSYCCKTESYTFTTKVIKITSSYQMFQPNPQLAAMQSYYFKIHYHFQYSLCSYFFRLYYWLHYSASMWINLLSGVYVTHLNLLPLVY